MSVRRGIQLPQALRDEIEAKEKDERLGRGRGGGGGKRGQSLSRKDARKASRTEKKERKAGFFSQPRTKRTNDDDAHPDAPPAKKARLSDGKPIHAAQSKPQPAQPKPTAAPKAKEVAPEKAAAAAAANSKLSRPAPGKTKLESLVVATTKKRRARDEEDDKIAYLEAKLGLDKKRKKKQGAGYSSAFAIDGLDDLLGDLDRIDGQLDLDDDASDADLDLGEDVSSEDDEDGEALDSDVAMDEGDEWQGIQDASGDESASVQSDDDEEAPVLIPVEETSATPKPSAAAESQGRYIPPALRKQQQLAESAPSEGALKLQRQLKGLLNRMSEQNIASVLADFEEAYRKHRRHDVTSTLTTLIIDGIASHGAHLDSFVVLHAALVGALHRLVGIEFAAHFVQAAVERYDAAYSRAKSQTAEDEAGKECANVLALLAALYALQVVACVLPYDLVRALLAQAPLSELDVELLLKLVRAAGAQMRADDPSALRDIVQLVQEKVAETDGAVGSRTKFMIETLVNLKNGKAKHGPDADGSAGAREVVERMKKFLSGLSKKRTVMAHEPLRVGLTDLREADKRGRWWLVGAAWSGDPLVERQTSGTTSTTKAEPNTEHDALLALARKHGMNTDVRRSIFVVLMSSEDCVDAAARVAALGLNDVQQREVARVALHCLAAERAYNPFWALVVLKTTSPAQRITLQFALWDFLRGMGEARVGGAEVVKNADAHSDAFGGDAGKIGGTQLENVARAYGWWIAKGACSITALKPLEFELLKPQTRRFVTRLLVHLFISTQVTSPAAPIAKATRKREEIERALLFAARVPTLQQGLLYFLNSAFKKPLDGPEGQLVQWAVDVAKDTLTAGVDIGALEGEWD
ncbi:hypothetical protein AURDEDRAFT_85439 [Auricularia subglabra TFB-10046 SS5]|nr:hypothetical protein AURDEDRAFT_85439 [Auricularia subglabra TFB-10046 SS5]